MISTRRQFIRGATLSAATLAAPGAFAQALACPPACCLFGTGTKLEACHGHGAYQLFTAVAFTETIPSTKPLRSNVGS